MRTSSGVALLACAVLLVSAQGCTQTDDRDAPASSSTASAGGSASSATEPTPSSPTSSPSAMPELIDAGCREHERAVVRRTAYPMQKAIDDLMRSTKRVSTAAAVKVRYRAGRTLETVLEKCSRPSAELRAYVSTARRHSKAHLSHRGLDTVLDSYGDWATAVGAEHVVEQLRRALETCRSLRRDVHASYRVWWRWEGSGRTWWIELTFRNERDHRLFLGLSGSARASGLVGRERLWTPRGRRSAGMLSWGASSYDYASIPPGVSRRLVAPGAGPYITTGPYGTFEARQVVVDITGRRSWWCSLPVPERS